MEKRDGGFTIWFTGLSGAGKTTIAEWVAGEFKRRQNIRFQLLDGDMLRAIHKDLGFSKEDRIKNIERAVYIAQLLNRHDVHVLASFITPYQVMRDYCRKQLDRYIEVYVHCPLSECIARDVKGLYQKALAGEIRHFTGISDPFEEPANPDLVIHTDKEAPAASAQRVIRYLEQKGWIPPKEKENEAP